MSVFTRSNLSVRETLRGKNIFLTGASGFLGKVLLEKLLRDVPDINSVSVLIRPRKGSTALERMKAEIFDSEIFKTLRATRSDFDEFFKSKVIAVAGELTFANCGMSEKDLQFMKENTDVIIHCAAVVDFNERMDRAVELNIMGAGRLLDIAKQCPRLGCFIHTSTCYVNCNRPNGWIDEALYDLGFDPMSVVNSVRKMDMNALSKISDSGFLRDWPNTYTFTKAIAESLMVKNRSNVPLVIVRPSIIGGSWREPSPGWTDVISAAGAVYASVGMGVLKFLPGNGDNIADVVPVDTVVNVMLSAIPTIWQQNTTFVLHASSSASHPMTWNEPCRDIPPYFNQHPPSKRLGPAEFNFVQSNSMYAVAFFARYSIPAAVLNMMAKLGGNYKHQAALYSKLVLKSRILIETFRHFTENQWIFSDANLKKCFNALTPEDRLMFNVDMKELDWKKYNQAFSYGLMRFVFKEDLIEINSDKLISLNTPLVTPFTSPLSSKLTLSSWMPDVAWAKAHYDQSVAYNKTQNYRSFAAMRQLVLSYPTVQEAMQNQSRSRKVKIEQVQMEAVKIFDKLCGDTDLKVMSGFSYILRKIWRRLYENIHVEEDGLKALREASKKGPILFVPTHRSYIDFLIVSYICFSEGLPVPCIMAGEDFLGVLLVRWLFRHSGAFFVRRSFSDDPLYTSIYGAYIEQLLIDGKSIEFFIEGTRSRSGKMLHPKTGMLSVVSNTYFDRKVSDLMFCPITINYEKTMEGDLYSNELLGENKIKESLRNLLSSSSILNVSFGSISVRLSTPISLAKYSQDMTKMVKQVSLVPGSTSNDSSQFDPYSKPDHRRVLVREFAYTIASKLNSDSECMPTHLVATLMLMYPQGLTKELLIDKTEWLRLEILKRGGKVALTAGYHRNKLVDGALRHLSSVIIERRKNVFEPLCSERSMYKNMLVLGHYRNKIVQYFFFEGLFCVAFYAQNNAANSKDSDKVSLPLLFKDVLYLSKLLDRENVFQSTAPRLEDIVPIFQTMVQRGIFVHHATSTDAKFTNDTVSVSKTGELTFSFLCALIWPFIDSYYVTGMLLYSLAPNKKLEQNLLLPRAQWLASTLYHDQMICSFESCSNETLRNAFFILENWKIIKSEKVISNGKKVMVSLCPQFQKEETLKELVDRVDYFRKPPARRSDSQKRSSVADVPILARL